MAVPAYLASVLVLAANGGLTALMVAAGRARGVPVVISFPLAWTAVASLALGLVGLAIFRSYLEPRHDNSVITGFQTGRPWVKLNGPPGWRTLLDPDRGTLSVERGTERDPTWAVLLVESTLLDEPIDLARLGEEVRRFVVDTPGLRLVDGPTPVEFAGLPAFRCRTS